jgi:hypothetical protein
MNIAAPMLGALLIEFLPLHSVLAVDVGTALLAILPLFFISIPQPDVDPSQEEQKTTVVEDMRLGFRYVWEWVGIRNIIFLAVLINLITMPAITLMPLLVKNEFSGGALEIASMQSSWAVGFLIGGILLSVWGGLSPQNPHCHASHVWHRHRHVARGCCPQCRFPAGAGWHFYRRIDECADERSCFCPAAKCS